MFMWVSISGCVSVSFYVNGEKLCLCVCGGGGGSSGVWFG